jgi:hypothetical protein
VKAYYQLPLQPKPPQLPPQQLPQLPPQQLPQLPPQQLPQLPPQQLPQLPKLTNLTQLSTLALKLCSKAKKQPQLQLPPSANAPVTPSRSFIDSSTASAGTFKLFFDICSVPFFWSQEGGCRDTALCLSGVKPLLLLCSHPAIIRYTVFIDHSVCRLSFVDKARASHGNRLQRHSKQ